MKLHSAYAYSPLKYGILNVYPSLSKNETTEIAILGAGITGALVAYHLCKVGFNVIMVDKRHVAQGSTAASTALLQYELDLPLFKLVKLVGERRAIRSYELCVEAIYKLADISKQIRQDSEFKFRSSFQFASFKKDVSNLRRELNIRKQHNISAVNWLEPDEIVSKFGFYAPAGILSKEGAEVNAYLLAHSLLAASINKGLKIYDHTEVIKINHHKNSVDLLLQNGSKIATRKLIICCGYESQRYIPKRVELQKSTYAIVSEPFAKQNFWYKNSLIWETAMPYLYLRTTSDNRILVGGKDDEFYNPEKRDERIPFKTKRLEQAFKKLFPQIPFKTDFAWAGTFCETKDSLPYIGSIPQRPNTLFALGFGGNGITFSLIAAEMIRDLLLDKKSDDLSIFSFSR